MGKGRITKAEARFRSYRLAELSGDNQRCKNKWDVEKEVIRHLLEENSNLWRQIVSLQGELASIKSRSLFTEQEENRLRFCTCTGQELWTTTSTFRESQPDLKARGF